MKSHRSLLAALACAALAAPSASALASGAALPVDVVSFSGTFTTTCTMPANAAGPTSGPYSCAHTARAVACAGIADSGPAATWAKVCRADLVSGRTRGSATNTAAGYSAWTCDNGAGTGVVAYQPSPAERTLRVPVNLVVIGDDLIVSGRYTQPRTGRTVVVRATYPAVCSWQTSVYGYTGTVTPA